MIIILITFWNIICTIVHMYRLGHLMARLLHNSTHASNKLSLKINSSSIDNWFYNFGRTRILMECKSLRGNGFVLNCARHWRMNHHQTWVLRFSSPISLPYLGTSLDLSKFFYPHSFIKSSINCVFHHFVLENYLFCQSFWRRLRKLAVISENADFW